MKTQLGSVVTWNARKILMLRSRLMEELENVGLPTDVKVNRPETFVARALHQADSDGLIRKFQKNGNPDVIAYAMVDEESSLESKQWTGNQRIAITYKKSTRELEFTQEGVFSEEVRAALTTTEGSLTTADLGGHIKKLLMASANAISLRDNGGVYFVPSSNFDTLDRIEAAYDQAKNKDGYIHINRFDVTAGDRTVSDISEMYKQTVLEEIASMKIEVRNLVGDLVRAKPSTFVKRAVRMLEIQKRTKLYATTLGENFSDIVDEAKDASVKFSRAKALCLAARKKARQKK